MRTWSRGMRSIPTRANRCGMLWKRFRYAKGEVVHSEGKLYLRIERPLFHSGTLSTKAPALVKIYPEAVARISPATAASLSLAEGDIVRISTKIGALELPVVHRQIGDCSTVMLTNNFEGRGAFEPDGLFD